MEKKILRSALVCALLALALPFAFAKPKYPKTASCPIDSGTAKPTGKTQSTSTPECIGVEYKHKGTNYSDPRHPQRFQHIFWLTICEVPTSANTSPSK